MKIAAWSGTRSRLCLLLVLGLVAGWLLERPVTAQDRMAEHVVLVSIDGLRPEFYLDSRWPAPMIQWMARRGAHAEGVLGVFPTVTYPSHTTMVTGALPSRHGIYYNTPFEPEAQSGRWYWEAAAIRVPTLWDAAREAGLKTAAITWPVSVGAPVNWLIPEVWSLDPQASPMDAMRRTTRPPELWSEIERKATGELSRLNFNIEYNNRDDTAGRAAAYLLETYRPALLAVHLLATDEFQHEQGREGEKVKRAVATADRAVAMMYEAVGRAGIAKDTAFIITGDHGFIDTHTRLAPNRWLVEAGLMEPRRDRGAWRATFHSAGGSAFLHLRDPNDSEALGQVVKILKELPPQYRRLFRILRPEQMKERGADPSSPLALVGVPGIILTSRSTGPLLEAAPGGTHGYYPTLPQIRTGFIGFGSGFREGALIQELALEDIAPLIARLLHLDFDAPDGIVHEGLLEDRDP